MKERTIAAGLWKVQPTRTYDYHRLYAPMSLYRDTIWPMRCHGRSSGSGRASERQVMSDAYQQMTGKSRTMFPQGGWSRPNSTDLTHSSERGCMWSCAGFRTVGCTRLRTPTPVAIGRLPTCCWFSKLLLSWFAFRVVTKPPVSVAYLNT